MGRVCRIALCCFAAVATAASGCYAQAQTAGPAKTARKARRMAPQQVADHVKKKDWSVVDNPGVIGSEAGPALLPLLNDPDPQVRELAVYSLNAAGGNAAREGLFKALHDRTDTVRSAACRFLDQRFTPEDVPALEKELSTNPDEYVRERVALMLGKAGKPAASTALTQQFAVERDEHAKRAQSLALARLGNALGRETVVARLKAEDPGQLAEALDDLVYVNDPKLLPETLPLLNDTRPAKNVGPSHGPFLIRVCDVAVNTIDAVLNHPFSFAVYQTRRYSQPELDSAKAVVSRLGP